MCKSKQVLSLEEAADYLGVSPSVTLKLINKYEVPTLQGIKETRVRKQDLISLFK